MEERLDGDVKNKGRAILNAEQLATWKNIKRDLLKSPNQSIT